MVGTIEDLLIHKEELYRKKEENLILKEQLEREQNLRMSAGGGSLSTDKDGKAETTVVPAPEAGDGNDIHDRILFDKLEHEIISRQLYLQPDFSREELIKTIYIPKINLLLFSSSMRE